MPRLPRLSSRELLRALERLGFSQVRQRGSHIVLQRGSTTCIVPRRREMKLGTLSAVLDQAEIEVDELLAALK
jgi:predicted RNA binding protein YcfA (HicA-like mRNA interferase family)